MTGQQPHARKPRLEPGVERPRDRFGRPLPWDAETELELLDYDSLGIEENHHLAIESFNEGVYFSAHEAWEGAWRQARGTPDEEFFKGLAQMGAGYTHMQRDNPRGARTLLGRAESRLEAYRPQHHGLDLDTLCDTLREHQAIFEADHGAGRGATQVEPPPLAV